MNGGEELSLKDLTFLRAIRDINESPERFASTEQGVTPATVTAITEATTLTEDEVAHRLDHPRLGKSGLVEVYEAGLPGDDSAKLNSAELTEAGETAIAEAEEQQRSAGEEWRPEEAQSEFSDVQEWEPADVENGATAGGGGPTAADGGGAVDSSGGGTTAGAVAESASTSGTITEPSALSTVEGRPSATESVDEAEAGSEADEAGTVTIEEDRLAALEARIEELEAEQSGSSAADDTGVEPAGDASASGADPERVEALHEEVAALRETTERLDSTLEEAVSGLEAIQESEYGALSEKREEQLRTAVKSMVAFHQLADYVLDVRVENYEPVAGRPDDERVEITRNRIGDALGVGKSGGGAGGMDLAAVGGDDADWPGPEDAASGRVFDGSDDDAETEAELEPESEASADEPDAESEAPETGVYPPIGSDDEGESPGNGVDDADEPEQESDAPDTGIYPPIGSNEEDEGGEQGPEEDTGDESDEESEAEAAGDDEPETADDESNSPDTTDDGSVGDTLSVDVEESAEAENIREAASERGHVMEPIRSTDGADAEAGPDGPPVTALDPESVLSVRSAIAAAKAERDAEPQAYARIIGDEQPTEALTIRHAEVTGLPAVPTEASRRFTGALDGAEAAGDTVDETGDD